MTGQEALWRAVVALRAAGIEDAEAEARLLLRHALRCDRTYLYLRLPEMLTAEQESDFLRVLRRRLDHVPAAYITGVREFYGIEFYVAPGVLIPRPETELLVDQSLRLLEQRAGRRAPLVFADAGTGSGAIVVAVAARSPRVRSFGMDRSPAALAIAHLNAHRPRLAGRVELLQGDLLEPLPLAADVVAANLPYIPTEMWQELPLEIREHEPREALDGGLDGLAVIGRLIEAAPRHLQTDGALVLEVGAGQAEAVVRLLTQTFPDSRCYTLSDLAGIERVAVMDAGSGDLPRGAHLR